MITEVNIFFKIRLAVKHKGYKAGFNNTNRLKLLISFDKDGATGSIKPGKLDYGMHLQKCINCFHAFNKMVYCANVNI